MGLFDLLSNVRDIFEIGRKTTSEAKTNKPQERKYDFDDGEKTPVTRNQYNNSKRSSSYASKNKKHNENKEDNDLEI